MIVDDGVYGTREISEPVALELIESHAMQRLKGVDQLGYSKAFFPGIEFNRFEHSVGVYLLLHEFSASLEEQIGGLLHDVSHTAFSHCMDFVVGKGVDQSHQDSTMSSFIQKTDIPSILEKYGFQLSDILEDTRHPLKERNLPDLCADRIDYSLRTGYVFKELTQQGIDRILRSLNTVDENWVFRDYQSAAGFAETFRLQNINHYAGFTSAAMFKTVSDYIRHGLDRGYIGMDELYATDDEVIGKMASWLPNDPELSVLWDRMNHRVKFWNDPLNYDTEMSIKSRVVDPLCINEGQIMRVSDIDCKWKEVVAQESKPKEYFIRFER